MTRLWICGGYTGCWICLNTPENALIMSQYGWICFNNADCNWICRHISEKTECWICQSSWCVWCSTKHNATEQITEHLLWQRCIQNIVKHLRGAVLQKEQWLSTSAQPAIFQVGEKGCRNRALSSTFCEKHKKRTRRETFRKFLSLILLKLHFEWQI